MQLELRIMQRFMKIKTKLKKDSQLIKKTDVKKFLTQTETLFCV